MHVIVTAIGSYGDVHPMAGIAERLAERGHDVTLAANPYFADIAERIGVPLLPLGGVDDYVRLTQIADLWHPTRGLPIIFREGVMRHMPHMYDTLASACRREQTVIVAHMLDIAAGLLRETHAARVVRVGLAPSAFWSEHQPPVLPGTLLGPSSPRWLNRLHLAVGDWLFARRIIERPLNRFRRQLGLAPVGRVLPDWWFDVDTTLGMFPDWFAPPQPDWPRPLRLAGFPLWDGGGDTPLSVPLQQFLAAGPPPLVWTAGTANRHAGRYFQLALAASRQLGRRAILLSKYAEQLPASLPAGVHHESFVPLTKLLPHCAAFVHHGGIGSASQALAAGVPQLVVSLGFDQLDNARRLCELGVAQSIRATKLTEGRLLTSLQSLLTADVATRARELAARCDSSGLDNACDSIEQFG
jgi:UDP:flavonoid glycosyltransferase YjiC (YdhE family)